MDSKVFRYVVALAETSSYSQAAKELYITPQGLANSIKRLETSVGVPLFKAGREGVALTQYGRVVCEFAKGYEREFRLMMDEIDKLKKTESKTISLSVSTGLFNDFSREDILGFNDCSKNGRESRTWQNAAGPFLRRGATEQSVRFRAAQQPGHKRFVPVHSVA